jgi:hypothetical protein
MRSDDLPLLHQLAQFPVSSITAADFYLFIA